MASESRPNPSKIDFMPRTFSNVATIGMLPPLHTGIGFMLNQLSLS